MRKFWLLSLFAAGSCVAYAWYAQSTRLYLNGNPISSGIMERGGTAYVPLKDVASAFHLSVQKTARGYELADSGGANQVEGITGKVGDVLFNGYVRFKVIKFERVKNWPRKYSGANHESITPIPEINDLFVVTCQLKNGTQRTAAPSLAREDSAVTDADGHSFSARRTSDAPGAQDLLPGAAVEFALVFDVPPGSKIQDLVYQPELMGVVGSDKKKFRITLAEGN